MIATGTSTSLDSPSIQQRLWGSYYEELEDAVLGFMAAGVPISMIGLTEPELKIDNNVAVLRSVFWFNK